MQVEYTSGIPWDGSFFIFYSTMNVIINKSLTLGRLNLIFILLYIFGNHFRKIGVLANAPACIQSL